MNKIISFGIYANQSDKRWNTFIKEMNERFNGDFDGQTPSTYYGLDKLNVFQHWSNAKNFSHIITLDDYFAEGSVYRVVSVKENIPLNLDQRWDTFSVIEKLVEATDILLLEKDYDGHGWELMEKASSRGKEIMNQIKQRQKLQQEIEQLEKELNVKRDKLKEYGNA